MTGVLDWGDLCVADPAIDLALAYAAFEGAPRTAFFSAHGVVGRDREPRARSLAICLSAMLAEALAGLPRAVC